jgi:hypothetical protein
LCEEVLAPEDLRNVWPEPKAEAKRKDEVEDALLAAACYRHTLTLVAAAQAAIARNWTATPVEPCRRFARITTRRNDERCQRWRRNESRAAWLVHRR